MKKDLDLERAVPPMPDSFVRRMDETLKEITHKKKRRSFAVTLAAAMVAVLALASVAVAQAIDSGILNRLFGEKEPPQEAAGLLQTDVNAYEKDGITLCVDELLYDGRSVSADWTVTSRHEDAVLLSAYAYLDGLPGDDYAAAGLRDMRGDCLMFSGTATLMGEKDGVSSPMSSDYTADWLFEKPLEGEVSLIIKVVSYATDRTLVPCDSEYPGEDEIRGFEENHQIGVRAGDGHSYVGDYPSYLAAQSAADEDAAVEEIMAASGLMEMVTEFTVSVPLEKREDLMSCFGPETYELDACALEVSEVYFSPAAVTMNMKIYPRGEFSEADFLTRYRFFVSADGEPWYLNLGGGIETDGDGRQYFSLSLSGPPVTEIPSELVFIRVDTLREGETPAAQYLRLIKEAGEGERAVMKLQ